MKTDFKDDPCRFQRREQKRYGHRKDGEQHRAPVDMIAVIVIFQNVEDVTFAHFLQGSLAVAVRAEFVLP